MTTNPQTDPTARIADAIRQFPFDNYGMDEVGFVLSAYPDAQEWVPALAAAVLAVVSPPPATLSGRTARRVAEDARAVRSDLYDDLDAFARQTGNPGLQHAQIRDQLAEFLFEGLLRRAVTAPATRADWLREAANAIVSKQVEYEAQEREQFGSLDHETVLQGAAVRDMAKMLVRMADEAQQQPADEPAQTELPYTHTDDDGSTLQIGAVMASTYYGETPVAWVAAAEHPGDDAATVYVRPERIEQVVTALRAAGRAALALGPTDEAPR